MSATDVGLKLSLSNRRLVSQGLKDTSKEIKDVGDSADKASRQTDRAASSWTKLGTAGGMLAKGVGIVGGAFIGAATAVGIFGVKSSASLETATMNLTTLTGSAKTARDMVAQLNRYGNATTFDTAGLATSAQQLLTFGIQAKAVIPDIKMLGDIAMGNQEKLMGLAYVFAQIQGVGHLMGGDLNQLINNGFNPLTFIAKRTGKSMGELRQEMSKGKISFDMVQQAMVDATSKGALFYHGAKNGSRTLAGAWGNLTGTIQSTLGMALLPAIKAVEGPMGKLGDVVSRHQKQINAAVTGTMTFFGTTFKRAERFVDPVVHSIVRFISSIRSGGGATSQFSKTWASLKTFIAPLAATVKDLARQFMARLMPGIRDISNVFTTQFLPALRKFLPVIQPVAKFLLQMLGGALIGALGGVIDVVKGVLRTVSGLFNLIADIAHGKWSKLWGDIKQILGGVLQALWGAIKVWWNVGIISMFKKGFLFLTRDIWIKGWDLLKSGASKGLGLIKTLLLDGVKGYIGLWRRLFSTAWDIVVHGWKVLRSAFGGALRAIRTLVGDTFSAVRGAVGGAMRGTWTLVRTGFTRVVGFVKGMPARIATAARGMFNGVKDAFRGAINWLIGKWNDLSFSVSVPHKIAGIPIPGGGGSFGLNTPNIPLLAHGGAVEPGKPYIVGDRGPRSTWELFVPDQPGYVHPTVPDFVAPPAYKGSGMKLPPIHVHVDVDGREIGHTVLNDFDTRAARR